MGMTRLQASQSSCRAAFWQILTRNPPLPLFHAKGQSCTKPGNHSLTEPASSVSPALSAIILTMTILL